MVFEANVRVSSFSKSQTATTSLLYSPYSVLEHIVLNNGAVAIRSVFFQSQFMKVISPNPLYIIYFYDQIVIVNTLRNEPTEKIFLYYFSMKIVYISCSLPVLVFHFCVLFCTRFSYFFMPMFHVISCCCTFLKGI